MFISVSGGRALTKQAPVSLEKNGGDVWSDEKENDGTVWSDEKENGGTVWSDEMENGGTIWSDEYFEKRKEAAATEEPASSIRAHDMNGHANPTVVSWATQGLSADELCSFVVIGGNDELPRLVYRHVSVT